MKCSECKFFKKKEVLSWLKFTGEFSWGYCMYIPTSCGFPGVYKTDFCSKFELKKNGGN